MATKALQKFGPVRSGAVVGVVLAGGEQAGDRAAQRRRPVGADGDVQEHPGAFPATLGQPGVAQDLDVARDARLALPEHLGQLAHRQLHVGEQPHDAQPRRIGERAQGGFELHGSGI